MSDFKKYLIVGSVSFIAGVILASVVTFFICKRLFVCPEMTAEQTIEIKQIQGKPGTIIHKDWVFKGKGTFCFKTKSTGKAEIQTTVSKYQIPEAMKWLKYIHGVQLKYSGLVFSDGLYRHVLEPSYLYRWDWFCIGGGPTLSFYNDKEGKKFGGGFHVFMQAWIKGK